ncbi:uncharacterized protein TrAFT101_004007 [Trichoderma asperellum]|uniref:uncharacterized protein n=1 Tax=Trichoderma asperellum TaxID=101201 RepID=UPI00332016B7|nr:hypothetical protein TrAFT101_004007 [Trichoderma asperellum]
MDTPAANTVLFCPSKIGNGIISNRIIMAPMARLRNCRLHVPLVSMVPAYFAGGASYPGTLAISEMAIISPRAYDYPHPPGIWTNEQVAAWKAVTATVHAQGSHIYLQIGALGRAAHPLVFEEDVALFGLSKDSIQFAASSLIPYSKDHPIPVELTTEEIKALIKIFATAARRAVNDADFVVWKFTTATAFSSTSLSKTRPTSGQNPTAATLRTVLSLQLRLCARLSML